jgi:hypothetical protein
MSKLKARIGVSIRGSKVFRILRRSASRREYKKWINHGKIGRIPKMRKHEQIIKYSREFGTRWFIESGTYFGETTERMAEEFEHVISIEIDVSIFKKCARYFQGFPNVKIINGDSGKVLFELVEDLDLPTTFWLDGHFSAGLTGEGDGITPILMEIQAISKSKVRGHVILIDDARDFNGEAGYPTVLQIQGLVSGTLPGSSVKVEDDMIIILPSGPCCRTNTSIMTGH